MTGRYWSPLGRMIPETMDVEDVKRRGWHEDRIIVIDMNNDRMDFVEREIFKAWADKRYGEKPKRTGG